MSQTPVKLIVKGPSCHIFLYPDTHSVYIFILFYIQLDRYMIFLI